MSRWSPQEIKGLRKRLGLTQKQFSEKIGVHNVTIIRWEKDQAKPNGLALSRLDELDQQAPA